MFSEDHRLKPWETASDMTAKYGKTFLTYFGQFRVLFFQDPVQIRDLLVSRASEFSYRGDSFLPSFSAEGGGYSFGIIASDGKPWREMRKWATQGLRAFGLTGTSKTVEKVKQEAVAVIQELDNRSGQVEHEMMRLIQNAVCNVIYSHIFGHRLEYTDDRFNELMHRTDTFFKRPWAENAIFFALPIVGKFKVSPFVEDMKSIQSIVKEILIEEMENVQKDEIDEKNPRSFIDIMVAQDIKPSDENFDSFSSIMTDMLLAGLETTSTALTWTLIYMCIHPDVQKRCQKEIDETLDRSEFVTLEHKPKLIYNQAVMMEILRFITIAPMALWHSNKNDEVVIDEYTVPKETLFTYNIWAVHLNKEYWRDPEVFRPERWIDRETGSIKDHSSHYMPFGTGPRICLGESLAKVEYLIFLTTMLQHFKFSFPPGYEVDVRDGPHMVTNMPPNCSICIEKRNF